MKKILMLACFAVAIVLMATACGTLFTQKPAPSSLIVTSGLATTNDMNAVAYINAARQLNTTLDPTPYAPLVNAGLLALAAVASAFGGWYARNHTATIATASALATSQQAIAIAAALPSTPVSLIPPLIPPKV